MNAIAQQLAKEVARAGDAPGSFFVAERLERIAGAQTRVADAQVERRARDWRIDWSFAV